jgi:hypothetical protein
MGLLMSVLASTTSPHRWLQDVVLPTLTWQVNGCKWILNNLLVLWLLPILISNSSLIFRHELTEILCFLLLLTRLIDLLVSRRIPTEFLQLTKTLATLLDNLKSIIALVLQASPPTTDCHVLTPIEIVMISAVHLPKGSLTETIDQPQEIYRENATIDLP